MKSLGKTVCLLLVLSLVFLLGLQMAAGAAEKELVFGYLVADQLHNPAPMIMKEKKLLEAEGLKVKWGEFMAGAYLMQHMASGEVDFGTCGAVPVMIAAGQGVGAIILAGSNTEGSALVVANSIKEFKDLDGKTIGTPGIGSIQDAMVDMISMKHNIKILHKNMKVSDMALFLQKGEIDGYLAWEPHASRAVDLGIGHILVTSHEILPQHQCCVLVGRSEVIGKDPEIARKIVRAYMKAFEYFHNNRDETIEMMAKATGMTKKLVTMSLLHVQHPSPPFLNIPSMKLMAEGLVGAGKIQKGVITDMDAFIGKIYDPSYLKEYIGKKKN